MKKTSILIAMFAVIAAVSSVRAEGFGVDFDKGSFRTADFIKAIAENEKAVPILPEGVSVEMIGKANPSKMYALGKTGMQRLHKEIIDQPIKSLGQDVLGLINNEKTTIIYNDKEVYFVSAVAENTYNILQTESNAQLINVLLKLKGQAQGEVYSQNKGWITVCKDVLTWVSLIRDGVEVTVQVYKYMCAQEWEDTPSTPGSGGTPSVPGSGGVPGIYPQRNGGDFNH